MPFATYLERLGVVPPEVAALGLPVGDLDMLVARLYWALNASALPAFVAALG